MKFLTSYLLVTTILLSVFCDAQRPFSFKIIGKAESSEIKKIFYSYTNKNNLITVASVPVLRGKFVVEGSMKQRDKVILYLSDKNSMTALNSLTLYPDKEPLFINFLGSNLSDYVLNEEQTEVDRKYLERAMGQILAKFDIIRMNIVRIRDSLQLAVDEKRVKMFKDSLSYLLLEEDTLAEKKKQIETDFIKKHPSSFLSLELLNLKAERSFSDSSIEVVSHLFDKLSLVVKKSLKGIKVSNFLRIYEMSGAGNYIPYFKIVSSDGKIITSETFRNSKFLLLDFWASWCVPCRKEFFFLKGLNNKYENKDLQIVGLSTDKDSSKFLKALDEEKLLWPNALIDENNHGFFVPAIPMKYLIDKNGIILGRWLGDDQKNQNAIEMILDRLL